MFVLRVSQAVKNRMGSLMGNLLRRYILHESNLDVGFEKINHQKEYFRFQMKQIFI